jgi:hypothetical protein
VVKINERYEQAKEIAQRLSLPIGAILKFQKEKGARFVYEVFNEVIKSGARNRPALFLYRIKNANIIWQ